MTRQFSTRLLSNLERAESVAVFTGAGILAESGVRTFRSDAGVWKKFKPEELANFDAFIKNPGLVWEWYKHRKHLIESILPNPGHCEIFFSVGTSAVAYPAASLPLLAKRSGAYVVEINLEPTEFSAHADEVLLGRAGEVLPELLCAYNHQSLFSSH